LLPCEFQAIKLSTDAAPVLCASRRATKTALHEAASSMCTGIVLTVAPNLYTYTRTLLNLAQACESVHLAPETPCPRDTDSLVVAYMLDQRISVLSRRPCASTFSDLSGRRIDMVASSSAQCTVVWNEHVGNEEPAARGSLRHLVADWRHRG